MPDRRMISRTFLKSSIAWKSGQIGQEPSEGLAALNLFLALILVADDYGNGRYIPQMLLIEALGSQPKVLEKYSASDVERWIETFESEGAVRIYEVEGQSYYSLTGWDHYQKGNWRPSDSNIPVPPHTPPEKKRTKKNGIEEKGNLRKEGRKYSISNEKAPDKSITSPERMITDIYQKLYLDRFNKKPPWGPKEGKRIRELLQQFDSDADRICKAIQNAFDSNDKFLSDNCGSFMTLTAGAVITKADTAGTGKLPFNKRLADDSKFTETGVIEL